MASGRFPCAMAFMLGAVSCKSAHDTSPSGGPAFQSPRIECRDAKFDFGQVAQGDRLTHTFRLKNAGNGVLRIQGVDQLNSCVASNTPQAIAPHESANLEVVCDTDERPDHLVDTLVVRSDDPLSARLSLELRARVEPRLAFSSRTVELKTDFGGTASQDVGLIGRFAAAAHLAIVAVDPGGPSLAVLSAENGNSQGLRFTRNGDHVGRGAGNVVVTTGLEQPKELTVLYSWQVSGNLVVNPANPYIDRGAEGPGVVVVKVSSSRPGFRLDDAHVVDGPFEASVAPRDAPSTYSVKVRVVESRVQADQRGLMGTLQLISNDPAEPRKEVPLFALGAPRRSTP